MTPEAHQDQPAAQSEYPPTLRITYPSPAKIQYLFYPHELQKYKNIRKSFVGIDTDGSCEPLPAP